MSSNHPAAAEVRRSAGAALIASVLGMRLPEVAAPSSSDQTQEVDAGAVTLARTMTAILDAMVDSAIIGIDTMTAQDLAFELCKPAPLVQAAVDQLVSDGHLRPAKKDGRKQTLYVLCRTH